MFKHPPHSIPVWSVALRILHWTLAGCTIAAFATHEGGGRWHEWLGYAAWMAAAVRVVLGFWGPLSDPYWRFAQFVNGWKNTLKYARRLLRRQEERHIGHNPLGAWMVLALLANSVLCGFTGWLSTTDAFWGYAWLANVHSASGHAFIPLVVLHLAGVGYSSWRHKESLIGAMMHGRKKV